MKNFFATEDTEQYRRGASERKACKYVQLATAA